MERRRKAILLPQKIFAEMVAVADQKAMKSKLVDQRKTCMWTGYAPNHAAGVYRVWNPKTWKVIETRDVIFLRKNYGDWKKENEEAIKNPGPVMKETISTVDEIDDVQRPVLVRRVSSSDTESDTGESRSNPSVIGADDDMSN